MKGYPATSRGNVIALYQAIQSYGADPEPILREAGVDLAKVDESSRQVSGEVMDRMICSAVEVTGDSAFGLRFSEFLQPTSYHALGVALLYSPTLRSFCQRLERYFAMVTTLDATHFTESDGSAYLSTTPLVNYSEVLTRCHSDGWAAWIVKLIRLMYRRDFIPVKITMVHSCSDQQLPIYQQIFQCEIEFSAPETRIYLDPDTLDLPLPNSNAELARQNDQVVVAFMAKLGKADIPSQVYAKLIEFLPAGECCKEKVAQALHMTVRTLHNKLESAGTSYQQLLDLTRKELAEDYIRKNEVSISEVAYLLGFTDISSFSRAFKRWTGMAPRNYRKSVE